MQATFELGEGPRRALLVHGFTGTPWEMRPLAERLAGHGYRVRVPLLAGHGTTPDELDRTGWRDWFASAEHEAQDLGEGQPIHVAGLSMGGLVGLHLAATRPELVASLATLAAAIRLVRSATIGLRLLRAMTRSPLAPLLVRLRAVPKRVGSDVADPMLRHANPGLGSVPLGALGSLVEFATLVRTELPGVRVPTLVLHGLRDHTVPHASAAELASRLGARRIRRVTLEHSYHQLPIDVDRDQVGREVASWFDAHDPAGGAAAAPLHGA